MNLYDLQEKLREKSRHLRIDKKRIVSAIRRENEASVRCQNQVDFHLKMQRGDSSFKFAKLANKRRLKHIKNSNSLDKILHQIKLDQVAYGVAIRQINSYLANWENLEKRNKIVEDLLMLLLRDPNYNFRHYEWGANW